MLKYLQNVAGQVSDTQGRWRCEVVVSESVAEGITDLAVQEGVDLIAMYTHDRRGLARRIRRSIADDVKRRAPIEVQIFRPHELEPPPEEVLLRSC